MPAKPEYCPVSIAASVVAERWNLLIVREVLAGSGRFNDIHRGLPGLSRTLLSQRLRQLQRAGLVSAGDGTYHLTEAGAALEPVLQVLGQWAVRWCFPRPQDDQLNPQLLMWRMRAGLAHDQLPDRRVVVQLDFLGDRPERGWLILDREDSSVCNRDPLFGIDAYAAADSRAWHEIWHGHRNMRDAMDAGDLLLSGETELVERFVSWFRLGRFAEQVADAALDQH
jgi:DNA-binding HxlR family transcriptional regulator